LEFVHVKDFRTALPAESFDSILGHGDPPPHFFAQNLQTIYRLLKPGDQIFFSEANYWNAGTLYIWAKEPGDEDAGRPRSTDRRSSKPSRSPSRLRSKC
jgi:hypothetical protein